MSGKRRVRDFQKVDPHLRDHPSFFKFVRILSCDPNLAHGILSGLWAFAFKFAHDGDLSRFDPEDIGSALQWSTPGIWGALVTSGFLEKDAKVSGWEDWGGALFTQRRKQAEDQWDRRSRDKQGNLSDDVERHEPMSKDITVQCPEEKREEKIKSVVEKYPEAYERWWRAFGRNGNKNEGFGFWQRWVKRGASTDDLAAAAANYRASDPRFPSYQWQARTFLATKNKEGMDVNRWHEWVTPEPRAVVTGNGQPAESPRDGYQWKRFTDYDERGNRKDEWREVPA